NAFASLNADHHILGVGVVFAKIMAVVRRHERQTELFLHSEEARMDAVLHLKTLVLYLKIKVLFAENIGVGRGRRARTLVLVLHQELSDLTFQTPRQRNQSFGVLRKEFIADTRLVI